jgi:predicted HicB family RNase H-like nuclease
MSSCISYATAPEEVRPTMSPAGATPEKAAPRTVSLRLPEQDHAALRIVAAARGISMSRYVEEIVRSELDRHEVAVASARRALAAPQDA